MRMQNQKPILAAAVVVALGVGCTLPYTLESTRGAPAQPVRNLPAAATPLVRIPAAPAMEDARASAAKRESDARAALVETALDALERGVTEQSHPEALRYAVQAYYNYKAAHPEQVKKPYLYFVDYGLDNHTPRGYVFDMETLSIIDGPFTVAHGRGSSDSRDGAPTRFSNRRGSNATSLGLYLAQETYTFRGTSGGRSYRSIGLRLRGLSGRFNSAARARGVVVHGAPYVTAEQAGRSEGCPAMEQSRAEVLIPKIANGGLVFHFSPLDEDWLREEKWSQDTTGPVFSANG